MINFRIMKFDHKKQIGSLKSRFKNAQSQSYFQWTHHLKQDCIKKKPSLQKCTATTARRLGPLPHIYHLVIQHSYGKWPIYRWIMTKGLNPSRLAWIFQAPTPNRPWSTPPNLPRRDLGDSSILPRFDVGVIWCGEGIEWFKHDSTPPRLKEFIIVYNCQGVRYRLRDPLNWTEKTQLNNIMHCQIDTPCPLCSYAPSFYAQSWKWSESKR